MNLGVFLFLAFGMILATVNDFKTGKIANLLTFPIMLLGITYHCVMTGWNGLGFSLGGLILGHCIFFIPYAMGGMGAGDAKLLGAAGSFLGARGVIIAAVLSTLLGLAYALTLLIVHPYFTRSLLSGRGMTIKTVSRRGQFNPVPHNKNMKQPVVRFALPIALGTLYYAYLKLSGSDVIQQFLGSQFSL
jgi:prepilin peptidase CpaA